MKSQPATNSIESGMVITRTLNVRRAGEDIEGLIEHILNLLQVEAATVDLSRHDVRGDVIYVRTAVPSGPP